MFTVANSAERTTKIDPEPPRKDPPYGLILLGLAVVCVLLVCIPVTRLAGLVLALLLAIPGVYLWLRERDAAKARDALAGWGPPHQQPHQQPQQQRDPRWAITSALVVLAVAVAAGLAVGLITGEGLQLSNDDGSLGSGSDFVGPIGGPGQPSPSPAPEPTPSARATPTTSAKPKPPAANATTKATHAPSRSASDEDRDDEPRRSEKPKVPACSYGATRIGGSSGVEICDKPTEDGYTWRPGNQGDIPSDDDDS